MPSRSSSTPSSAGNSDLFQKARATKNIVDIDFDVPDASLVDRYLEELDANGVEYMVLATKGGYHVMCRRSTLKYNYVKSLEGLDKEAKARYGKAEVIENDNAMVPIAGCAQAGVTVTVYKET